jgi:hypothetical protein
VFDILDSKPPLKDPCERVGLADPISPVFQVADLSLHQSLYHFEIQASPTIGQERIAVGVLGHAVSFVCGVCRSASPDTAITIIIGMPSGISRSMSQTSISVRVAFVGKFQS